MTFLIAHTNEAGTGIAQAQFTTRGTPLKSAVQAIFEKRYPDRVVTRIGIQGQEDG